MLKLIQSLSIFTMLLSSVAMAQPTQIDLAYDVSRNGKAFGTVKERYQQTGEQYRIVSTTKGQGVYAILGERVLSSEGAVTADGLKPTKFQLKRGDNKRKSLTANFNWANAQLKMLRKGKEKTAKLLPGTQDLASYAYQFMFTPPTGEQVKMSLTTGKKLKLYTYNITRDVTIKAAGKNYQAIHLVNAEIDGKKKKELWLAKVNGHDYIPVKYLVVDKHGDKLEQTLSKASIP